MMEKDFRHCEVCKKYHWTNKPCDPEYKIYHDEYMGDEAVLVRGCNHEEAAENYGKYYNENDSEYPLMNESIEIKVIDQHEVVKFFRVGAEPDIHYSTTEIEKSNLESE